MAQSTLDKWLPAAKALSQVKTEFTTPVHILLSEAGDLARFTSAYWEPVKAPSGKILRPGLVLAGPKLSPTIGREILELQDALQTANTHLLVALAPKQPDMRVRAEFVLSEIAAALEWWPDAGVEAGRDQQMAALTAEYADGWTTAGSLGAVLFDFAALARQEESGLQTLGGFEMSVIDEAEDLARQLRRQPTDPLLTEDTQRALDARNRIATLLVERMARVRAAARFVFRHQPEIARQSSSAFERIHPHGTGIRGQLADLHDPRCDSSSRRNSP